MFGFGCGISVEISLLKVTVCSVASLPRAASSLLQADLSLFPAVSSLLQADPSLFSAASSLLQADLLLLRAHLVTSACRFVTYRPRDGKFTARGTVSLPPEGRQVYRPRGGK